MDDFMTFLGSSTASQYVAQLRGLMGVAMGLGDLSKYTVHVPSVPMGP